MEVIGDPEKSFTSFAQIFSTQKFIDLRQTIYMDLEHMGTAIPSFEDGIAFIFND
jgi:hypothetical protein